MNMWLSRFITFFLTVFLFNRGYCQYKDHIGFRGLDSIGVHYSHVPGLYAAPIDLSFDLPKGYSVKYVVGWDQASKEFLYRNPIRIDESTFISITVTDSIQKKYTYQANFIIGRDISLPVICLTVTPNDFFPPNGIYEGSVVKNGDKLEASGNAFKKKPIRCFAEFFYNKRSVVATSCWLKTFGGFTLGLPEKSLHLVADEKLGDKEFRYKFFPEKPYNEFEHLVLRTSGSDYNATRFQDICLSSLAADMNIDHMTYQPCVVFINDKYFGILNLREKINFDYLRYNHHAIKDSTCLVTADGHSSDEYQLLMNDLVRLNNDSNYAELIGRRMDIENYMNYIILQLYIANTDSRGNIRYWKSKNLDNRWRWIFYDSDLGCQAIHPKNNFIADRISPQQTEWYNPTWATHILRNLIADPTLKDRFINQVCLLTATRLHHDTIISRIDSFGKWIEPEIPYHVKRYPIEAVSEKRWYNSIDRLKEFFVVRKDLFHEHFCKAFGLSPQRVRLQVSSNMASLPLLALNSSSLCVGRVDGLFYKGRSIAVEAKSFFPYVFDRWLEDGDTNAIRSVDLSVDHQFTAQFAKASFNSQLHQVFGIAAYGTEMKSKEDVHWIALFNLSGKKNRYHDFKLHFFGVDTAITISDAGKWNDSTFLVITNHPKKWKKRNPTFKGNIIQAELTDAFIQQGVWYLSLNDSIVDSLAFAIHDSLMNRDKRWVVIQSINGIEYIASQDTLPDISSLRPNGLESDMDKCDDQSNRLILFCVLIMSVGLGYVLLARKNSIHGQQKP